MNKNHLLTACNRLLQNRLYSAINIIGLAFGLAASIMIMLYVLDETSYDKNWEKSERLYRVNTSLNFTGDGFRQTAGTALPTLPALQRFFGSDLESGSRFMPLESEIVLDTQHFEVTMTRVDGGFLDMFELETLAGSMSAALSEPSRIALRADVATRFFGNTQTGADVIGKVLTISNNGVSRDYEVAAVYRMPAGNTVLDLPLLTLLDESVLPPVLGNWGILTMYTYVLLAPGVDAKGIRAMLGEFTNQNVDISSLQAGPDVRPDERMRFDLQDIGSIHLNSAFDATRAGGNPTIVIAFTGIAILVLLMGIINFTILTTANASRRAKEVALRKSVGASRRELVGQFLLDSFSVVLPAILFACVLVELLLPVFEAMVARELPINWFSPATFLGLVAMYLAVSVLGGLYPALVLSRFRPADTFKGQRLVESAGSLTLRNLLVIFQFGISIALIIATGVIYAQVRYAMERDPGFRGENLLVIDNLSGRAEVNASKETLKQQLLDLEAVTAASLSSHQPTQTLGMANITSPYSVPALGGSAQALTTLGIDYDFFSTYETRIVAGRDFSAAQDLPAEIYGLETDGPVANKLLVNESASRALGFARVQDSVGQRVRFTNPRSRASHELTIIGVAADTNFYSLNAIPRPEVYSLSPGLTDVLTLRFEGDPQALLEQVSAVWRRVMGDAELSTSLVTENMAGEFAREQTEAQLLVSFSLLAIIIACLGLYGSVTFTMERRTREIGIRKIMGAEVRELVALLLWQFSKPVLIANVIAWPAAAWALLTWLQRFPYRIDALMLLPLCILAGGIALSIAWLTVASSTVRVATTSPVLALRYE